MARPQAWALKFLNPRSKWWRPLSSWVESFAGHGAALEVLGSGHFGTASRVRLSSGEPSGLVLKVTIDPTEGPMCDWVRRMQEQGAHPFRLGFARVFSVVQLADPDAPYGLAVKWKKEYHKAYAILREEVDPFTGGKRDAAGTLVSWNRVAVPLYEVKKYIEEYRDRRGAYGPSWVKFSPDDVAQLVEYNLELLKEEGHSALAQTFRSMAVDHRVALMDVHGGNIGYREWGQGSGWSPIGTLVIFDPGHTPTDKATEVVEMLRRENSGSLMPVLE